MGILNAKQQTVLVRAVSYCGSSFLAHKGYIANNDTLFYTGVFADVLTAAWGLWDSRTPKVPDAALQLVKSVEKEEGPFREKLVVDPHVSPKPRVTKDNGSNGET